MREQSLEWDLAIRDEARALLLTTAENVHEACTVSCRRNMCLLTSIVVWPPSPTNATRPHVPADCSAPRRPSDEPEQSMVVSAPSPRVRSWIAFTASASLALITCSAPKSRASARRSGTTSTAMTRAPIARPSIVALSPTGPWPKIASVSRPDTSMRLRAPYAVPVPHETDAPSSNDSSSGSGTQVNAGAFIYRACPP